MLRRAALALACLAAVAAAPVHRPRTDPVVVQRFVEVLRDNITLGKLPDGSPMARETPAERAQPILPAVLAQQAFDRGLVSGGIEACAGNWRVMNFDPFITELKSRADRTPKQLGFAVMLHDAGREQGNHIPDEQCTPEAQAALAAAAVAARGESAKLP